MWWKYEIKVRQGDVIHETLIHCYISKQIGFIYSPLFVCNSLLQSNPWHWKFEMLYKLICIKNISNNETLSNILEIVIKYLNQINNFLGSLNKELLYKFFNSIEEFLKLNFRNLTYQPLLDILGSWNLAQTLTRPT